VNQGVRHGRLVFALLAAALLLTVVAWQRGAEYDEQYTLFLTGRAARPDWPQGIVTAGDVRNLQRAHTGFASIARDLRRVDVHPPLYFWTIAAWRRLFGDSLFAARMASVSFSIATLVLVAIIARSTGVPAVPAVLLTVGCYGFAYTGAVARGFALAQMLSVAGIAVLLCAQHRARVALAAGTLLGAATFANYLAAFVAYGALLHIVIARDRRAIAGPALLGFVAWLPADLWFFLAQKDSRVAQFEPFTLLAAVPRLARYAAATVFGGLPLYVDGLARAAVSAGLALLLISLLVVAVWRWRLIATPSVRRLFAMAALAPPTGLMLLGLAFNNTPIELRYLAFATPFVGLLLAGALPHSPRHVVLAIQALALLGLIVRSETMQPARATAMAAASLVDDGVVLLPRGNDGVGIVGAFAIESPSAERLLVIDQNESPAEIRAYASRYPRVVLALLGQDGASRATLPVMRLAFADPCWRAVGQEFNVLALERSCGEE
jgi:hypothetical protein